MSDIKLKACPFCGSKDITVDTFKVKNDRWQSGVVCSSCLGGIDTLNTYLTPEESKTSAIEAWNRRDEPWIPVSERLPEDVEEGDEYPLVIFCTEYATYVGCYDYVTGKWWIEDFCVEDVIKWMPLPEPPEPYKGTEHE